MVTQNTLYAYTRTVLELWTYYHLTVAMPIYSHGKVGQLELLADKLGIKDITIDTQQYAPSSMHPLLLNHKISYIGHFHLFE